MNLRRVNIGAGLAALAAAVWVITWQEKRTQRLASENATLREQVEQAAQWREENQRLVEQVKAAGDRSQSESRELMRLRSQAASLRQAEQENARLKAERDRLASQVQRSSPRKED